MGRKRTPCDFCSGEYWPDGIDRRNGFYLWMEVYPFNNLIAVIAQANDENGEMIEDYIDIPMNFCPNCGRDLTKWPTRSKKDALEGDSGASFCFAEESATEERKRAGMAQIFALVANERKCALLFDARRACYRPISKRSDRHDEDGALHGVHRSAARLSC